MTNPLPPPSSCPIGWQPCALTPVFYGVREYTTAQGAPARLRVYFPSLNGGSSTSPILSGCGRYPAILFAHGFCETDANHFRDWTHLPSQLARSGYVVVVPEILSISEPPYAGHPAQDMLGEVLTWLRQTWEYRQVLMPAAATGVAGHSFGGLHAAQFALTSTTNGNNTVAAYAGLSAEWHNWTGSSPLPVLDLNRPKLVTWGEGNDVYATLTPQEWNSLSAPKHRATYATGEHWDYLPAGSTPCAPNRGPCPHIGPATADLVTMFFARYLPPELSPHLRSKVPYNLVPPPLALTEEQQFYAGGHLVGFGKLAGTSGCGVTLTQVTGDERAVPDVRQLPKTTAQQTVLAAGLAPVFTGSGTWVFSQSPAPGTMVQPGATVTMSLRTGAIP